MRRRVSDRSLRRWLDTGRPARVADAIEADPSVAERLDAMTALRAADSEAIGHLVTPPPQFHDRAYEGVRDRIDRYETMSVVADLLGLGFHVGQVMLAPDEGADRADDETDGT